MTPSTANRRWWASVALVAATHHATGFVQPACPLRGIGLTGSTGVGVVCAASGQRRPSSSSLCYSTRSRGLRMSDHTEDRLRRQTFAEGRGGAPRSNSPPPQQAPLILTNPMDLVRVRGFGSGSAAGHFDGRSGRGSGRRGGGNGGGRFGDYDDMGGGYGAGRERRGAGRGYDDSGGSFGRGGEQGRGGGGAVLDSSEDVPIDPAVGGGFSDRRGGFKEGKKKVKGAAADDTKDGQRTRKGERRGRKDSLQRVALDEEEDEKPVNLDDFVPEAGQEAAPGAAASPVASKPKAPKPRQRKGRGRKMKREYAPPPPPPVVELIQPSITVGELATQMRVKPGDVLKHLMLDLGIMAAVTQSIDAQTARMVAMHFGVEVTDSIDSSEAEAAEMVTVGDMGSALDFDSDESLVPRAPVVTIMGHVDHGKTSLLDAIRETKVVSGEAGGITQHISAYQVSTNAGANVTFVDTPGHAAFSEMRARGANATDVVVLVVAADDGVMDQTKESIATAKMANVPVVVAINKMDKPDADVQKVQNELMAFDLVPEEFGGDTQIALVSAKQKTGLDELLEKILLQAEVLELKSNPDRQAQGVVIEAQMEKGMGSVGTILIQRGTVRVGDVFVAGGAWGKVRTLMDHTGKRVQSAGPSTPVQVGGFDGVPDAGDMFTVCDREDVARDLAEARRKIAREANAASLQGGLKSSVQAILSGEADVGKEIFELPVMVKADVQGSEQALYTALSEMKSEDEYFMARCKLLQSGVGQITKSDIAIAAVSRAYVVGFNVGADFEATKDARASHIDIGYYSVVYNVMDDIQKKLDELVSPTPDGVYVGKATVLEIFNIGKVGNIAGSSVLDGVMSKGGNVLVKRMGRIQHEGKLKTLKNVKSDVQEMVAGTECGIQVEGFEDFEEGDIIECYKLK